MNFRFVSVLRFVCSLSEWFFASSWSSGRMLQLKIASSLGDPPNVELWSHTAEKRVITSCDERDITRRYILINEAVVEEVRRWSINNPRNANKKKWNALAMCVYIQRGQSRPRGLNSSIFKQFSKEGNKSYINNRFHSILTEQRRRVKSLINHLIYGNVRCMGA